MADLLWLHPRKPSAEIALCLLWAFLAVFAFGPCREAAAEGSYQIGLNQFMYDYNHNYSSIPTLNRPKYVDIVTSGEIINVSLCGRTNADRCQVVIIAPNATTTTYNINAVTDPGHVDVASAMNAPLTNPIRYNTATQGSGVGTYEIRLYNTSVNSNSNAPASASGFWRYDITVTPDTSTNPDPRVAGGRLYAYSWAFTAGGFTLTEACSAKYYTLVPGGRAGSNYVWLLDLNNLAGYVYDIIANDLGANAPYSGYSIPVASGSTTPKWPVYVGYPAIASPPPAVPPIISNLRFVDDAGVDMTISPNGDSIQDTGNFLFTSDVAGTYAITLDLNHDGQYGAGDRLLLGNIVVGSNSVAWNGKDASGATVPSGTYTARIQIRMGEYHFLATDVETSGGGTQNGLTIREVNTDHSFSNNTLVFWDDQTILSGTTTLPNGELCNSPTARHTWGNFTSTSLGNDAFMDTYVYGKSTLVTTQAIVAASNTPINSPVLDLDANNSSGATGADYQTAFTVLGSAIEVADSDISITDDGLTLATATITNNSPQSGDQLSVAPASLPAGITLNGASDAQHIILNGPATLADFQTAIRLVLFQNTLPGPAMTNRTVSVVVNDGTSDGNLAVCMIQMIAASTTPTTTFTPTTPASPTLTQTPTTTYTAISTPTPSPTFSATASMSPTAEETGSPTPSCTPTHTETTTPPWTPTCTPTPTETAFMSATSTESATPLETTTTTPSFTVTVTPTAPDTATPSMTPSPSGTPSLSATPETASPTCTPTPSRIPSQTVTPTPQVSVAQTQTPTQVDTASVTPTTTRFPASPNFTPEKTLKQGGGYAEPNPFFPNRNQTARFVFTPENPDAGYHLRIYTIKNRMVRSLENQKTWDGKDDHGQLLESGVYIYQIDSGTQHQSGTVVLIAH